MTIRPATLDDLDAIMTLERASFLADAWSESMMREELASPHTHYVVLVESGVRGYAGLRAPKASSDADIQTIALAETARGRGQGRLLLRTLLAEAVDRGVREVFLDVRDDNDVAQRLYASEGFVAIGRRPKYYAAEGVDAIVMRLDLTAWAGAHAPFSENGAEFGASGLERPKSTTFSENGAADAVSPPGGASS